MHQIKYPTSVKTKKNKRIWRVIDNINDKDFITFKENRMNIVEIILKYGKGNICQAPRGAELNLQCNY